MHRQIILLLTLLTSLSAYGQMDERNARAVPNNVLAQFGMNAGGLTLGFGYEYMFDQAQGIGGHFRYFSKDTSRGANGMTILGAMTGYHFFKRSWDFALSPSFNIIQIDSTSNTRASGTNMGPGLALSLTNQLNDHVAIGFEYSNWFVWFGKDYFRGLQISDLAIRLRYSF
jgi:hypothetical protein